MLVAISDVWTFRDNKSKEYKNVNLFQLFLLVNNEMNEAFTVMDVIGCGC